MHFEGRFPFKYIVPVIVILAMLIQAGSVLAQVPSTSDHQSSVAFLQSEGEEPDAEPTATPTAEVIDDQSVGEETGGEGADNEEGEGEEPGEAPPEGPAGEVTEEPSDEDSGDVPEGASTEDEEEPTEGATEDGTEEAAGESTEEATEDATDEATEEPTAEATDVATEEGVEEPPEEKTFLEPEFSWSLEVYSLNSAQMDMAKSLKSNFDANGVASNVDGVRKKGNLYLSGSGGVKQVRKVLYEQLQDKISLISDAAEVVIEMPLNQVKPISINLESNLSAGYRWHVLRAEVGGSRMGVSEEFTNRRGIGTQVKQTITFKPDKTGLAVIHLVYRRSFDKGEQISRRLTMGFVDMERTIELSDPSPIEVSTSGSSAGASGGDPFRGQELKGELPSSWDWRSQGVVPAVRNQGACGSCWAFGTVGILESAMVINESPMTDMSEQFLISCNRDGWGCNGGLTGHKYHYDTKANNQLTVGAVLESDMPYTASEGGCSRIGNHPYKLADWEFVDGSEWVVSSVNEIKTAIYNYGPVTTAICVGDAFQDYDGGVFSTNENCGGYGNHQIILVGWDDGDNAWILRNSWGTGWGESGYMRIAYGTSGVGEGTSWVVVADPEPGKVVLSSPENKGYATESPTPLVWNSDATSSYYHLQVSKSKKFNTILFEQDDIEGTSLNVALDDAKYYWRVRGKNGDGVYGAWSVAWYYTQDTLPPTVPVLSSPADGSEIVGIPTFKWGKANGASAYQFEYGESVDPESYIHRSDNLKKPQYVPPTVDTMVAYYWFVRAVDRAGNWSDWSEPFTVTIVPPPPGSPTLLSPAKKGLTNDATPTFEWHEVNYDGGGYQIMVDTDKKLRSPDIDETTAEGITEFTLGSELADGRYYWRVRARNINGVWGRWSKVNDFTVDTIPPDVPVLLSPADGSQIVGTPTFKWGKANGASAYQFEYGESNDPDSYIHRSDNMAKPLYVPPMMDTLTPYYWFVRAVDRAGNWSDWSEPFTVTIVPPPPGSPTLLSPANKGLTNDTTPTFEWHEVNYDGGGYQIVVDTDKKFRSPDIDETTTEGITEFTPGLDLPDGRYYWYVRAKNAIGAWGRWSKVSYFTVDTIPPDVPVLNSPADGSQIVGTPMFKWGKAAGASAYQFEYGEADDPESYIHRGDNVTKPQYVPPTMDTMIPYYWFARAVDKAGNWSDWSGPFTVTIVPPPPGAPTLISPEDRGYTVSNPPAFEWAEVNYDGGGYEIRFGRDKNFQWESFGGITGEGETTYTYDEKVRGGVYYWQVRAKNANGDFGEWSRAKSFSLYPIFNTQFNENGNLEGWQRENGIWNVSDGTVKNTSHPNWITNSMSYPDNSFFDFTYESRVKMADPGTGENYHGVILRGWWYLLEPFMDWQTGYYFMIWQFEDDIEGDLACFNVFYTQNDNWTSLTPGKYWWCYDFINFAEWNDMKATARGSHIDFYINDYLVLSTDEITKKVGAFGAFNYGDGAYLYEVDWARADIPEENATSNKTTITESIGYVDAGYKSTGPTKLIRIPEEMLK